MFSTTTIASSTTKPVEMVSAINDRLSMLKPHKIHHAEGSDQRNRNRHPGNHGGAQVAQEQEDHHHYQANRD